MSRRGAEIGSLTLRPRGIAHRPHPGAAEASIGKEGTEELAVMMTTVAQEFDDPKYPYSWLENDPVTTGAE